MERRWRTGGHGSQTVGSSRAGRLSRTGMISRLRDRQGSGSVVVEEWMIGG
jgi:hypothetical protein